MARYKSKLLLIAFILSLALNLSIAGFIGAKWVVHGRPGGISPGPMINIHEALETLNRDERQAVKDIWKNNHGNAMDNFREARETRKEFSQLFAAQELDVNALRALHERARAHREKTGDAIFEVLIQIAVALPPEKRADFFKKGFRKHFRPDRDKSYSHKSDH